MCTTIEATCTMNSELSNDTKILGARFNTWPGIAVVKSSELISSYNCVLVILSGICTPATSSIKLMPTWPCFNVHLVQGSDTRIRRNAVSCPRAVGNPTLKVAETKQRNSGTLLTRFLRIPTRRPPPRSLRLPRSVARRRPTGVGV